MIIIISSSSQECILTDPKSLEDFTLTAEPQNNLKAHWDFRSNGKSQQRYYIGTLLKQKNFKEIEWSEMRKNRKTDKWIRIEGISPTQYLEKSKQKLLSNQHKRRHYNSQNNKRIIRKNNNKHNMNEDDQYYHRHPSMLQKSRHHQQYSSTSPNLQYQQKSSPKYVPKIKSKMNNNDNSQSQINDPAIMNMGNASSFSHSMTELDRSRDRDNRDNPYRDPFNDRKGGSGSSRDRDRDRFAASNQPKYQTQHRPTARNQYYAEYYPKFSFFVHYP